MTGLVAIASEVLAARINPLGAELWSLTDRDGGEYMTDADPAFWTGRAPLLFPIVGALNGGRYRVDGTEHALPKHGFARTSRFDLAEHADDRARFRLVESEATLAAYPFRFELEMAFALTGATLSMVATVGNPGAGPLPFSFGFHPAFAWPLPGGAAKDDHAIVFERDDGLCGPHRGVQIGPGAERRAHEGCAVLACDDRPPLARRHEQRAGAAELILADAAGSPVHEKQRVVDVVEDRRLAAGAKPDRVERELGAALGRDERLALGVGIGSHDAGHLREHRKSTPHAVFGRSDPCH